MRRAEAFPRSAITAGWFLVMIPHGRDSIAVSHGRNRESDIGGDQLVWLFPGNGPAKASSATRMRLFIEVAVLAWLLLVGLPINPPQIYMLQSTRAENLAEVAARRARYTGSNEEREFYRREAAWYRGQSRGIYWRAIWYGLGPGYGPHGRDEQSDVTLTIRDLATGEQLDQHGFGWSWYQLLAEDHARGTRQWKGFLHEFRPGKWDSAGFDLNSIKRNIDWHKEMEQYYLRALSHPWEALPPEPPSPSRELSP